MDITDTKDHWSRTLDRVVLHDDPMMSDTLSKTDHCYSASTDIQNHRSGLKRASRTSENPVGLFLAHHAFKWCIIGGV